MKVFDFNIHLPCNLSKDVNSNILNENNMSVENLDYCYNRYLGVFKKVINAGNFMLFNQKLFSELSINLFISNIKTDFPNSLCTALIDFRNPEIFLYLEDAILQGIDAIKFHSYHQKITDDDFTNIGKICQYAEQAKLMICIDTSYGTTKMYEYDNLKLACYLSEIITKVPIILLHSGGARVLEAMLIAEEKQNVYLETSFSVLYYLKSSLEQDMAFAYKKIGVNKVLYGSDFPYVDLNASIEKTVNFLEKYEFSTDEIENIFFRNAINIRNI